ncbi:outer membrane usher protein [Providencia rettgeri]|uniref:outer membrane usher protein n=1 Tax=Providencia rettgeri TaxID=587 RepID=UPI001BA5CBB4|nr:outer membrane usher protein [Providencia rettgeri]MBS0861595.1 outer membrane usher protein [Providencia rettgeri]MBS0875554.1 outer membrane usher protein [Providencia rettgeri]MBS0922651.1 outer membrane usher protein [Providencia rettgeri]
MFFFHNRFRIRASRWLITLAIAGVTGVSLAADTIQFNTDVLDLEDKSNIDLDQFSRAGHIMPGTYRFSLKVNDESLPEVSVPFYAPEGEPQGSVACLSPEVVAQLGLTVAAQKQLTWWHDEQCLDAASVPGLQIRGDLATSTVYVSLPQAYLEYSSPNWDPPSRWDEGVPAIMLDYHLNGNANKPHNGGLDSYALNGNGVVGMNFGAWRFRADWQGRLNHATGSGDAVHTDWDWSRLYAFRALPTLKSKLTLGEDYLNSDIFDSFRFIGGSLQSDLNMVPPNLRGYAPEVTGVANSNATVTIRQQGRVLYETQVAPGPFRIQDLSEAVSGQLDVTVKEQDGSVREFQVDTASLPYLTRPGQWQYKLSLGQPTTMKRHSEGDNFATGEVSLGVNNGWSVFGGSLNSEHYNAVSVGAGRDLLALGALSLDFTQSFARLPEEGRVTGGSYRVNYAKRFEAIDGQIQFAGYRFSDRNFMSMSDFLNARKTGVRYGSSKEMYTVSINKNFQDVGLSAYLNYNHQTYWDSPSNDTYSLMLAKYFDIGTFKNVSVNVTAQRSEYNEVKDDSVYVSTSFPFGQSGNVGYSLSSNRHDTTHRATYYDRVDERTNYSLAAGSNRKGGSGSAFVTHQGDIARLTASASYAHNQYSAYGLSASGGFTVTGEGAAAHRMGSLGGARLLVDTDGVAEVPIKGFGAPVSSNSWGKAVIGDMSAYYRNQARIDLNALPDNMDAATSVVQATLTEGAVGYRHFSVVSGQKAMTVLRLPNGHFPPFGAQVHNRKGQQTGIVGDAGSTYLSGLQPGETQSVTWGDDRQCDITLPAHFGNGQELLLPCLPVAQIGP